MTKTLYFFTFLLLIGLFSCFSDGNLNNNASTKNVINDSTFNDMVRTYEDEDRVVWQKPEIILSKIGDLNGKIVADIGAGTGYFSFRMLKDAKKVIALDIEPRFLRFIDSISLELPASMSSKLETRLVESQNANLKPNEIDAALMVNTYMYVNNRVDYLKQLYNGVSVGGKVVIIDFKKQDLLFGPALDEKLAANEVVKELQSAGFQTITLDEQSLDYQYIVTALR
jgi:ubiquinone/menaquinone biosynthesis C-methylase UbiE